MIGVKELYELLERLEADRKILEEDLLWACGDKSYYDKVQAKIDYNEQVVSYMREIVLFDTQK